MGDGDRFAQAKRAAFGDKADLATAVVQGSGISETLQVSLDLMHDPQLLDRWLPPWTENREMIVQLFSSALEDSRNCPGRDSPQCCQAQEGQGCSLPNWREREDVEWYAQQINIRLSQVDRRIREGGALAAQLAADDAFELGRLFAEALIKFRWDDYVKRRMEALDHAKSGGKAVRDANRQRLSVEQTVAAVEEFLAKGVKAMDAYRRVARLQGVTEQTIRKEFKTAKKPR